MASMHEQKSHGSDSTEKGRREMQTERGNNVSSPHIWANPIIFLIFLPSIGPLGLENGSLKGFKPMSFEFPNICFKK